LFISLPSTSIVPDVGDISLFIIFSMVVLPQPEGPTNITKAFSGISMLKLLIIGVPFSYSFEISLKDIILIQLILFVLKN